MPLRTAQSTVSLPAEHLVHPPSSGSLRHLRVDHPAVWASASAILMEICGERTTQPQRQK